MTKQTKSAETSTAYGKELDAPIKFSWEWVNYDNNDEVDVAMAWLSKDKQRRIINGRAENKARQAAQNAALKAAGHEPSNMENDEQFRLRVVYKGIMLGGKHTEDSARALASQATGVQWDDNDDDE